jgi:hypothetical protein
VSAACRSPPRTRAAPQRRDGLLVIAAAPLYPKLDRAPSGGPGLGLGGAVTLPNVARFGGAVPESDPVFVPPPPPAALQDRPPDTSSMYPFDADWALSKHAEDSPVNDLFDYQLENEIYCTEVRTALRTAACAREAFACSTASRGPTCRWHGCFAEPTCRARRSART